MVKLSLSLSGEAMAAAGGHSSSPKAGAGIGGSRRHRG